MKKTIRIIAVLVIVAMACAMLASCSKMLFGTYSGEANLAGAAGVKASYKFAGSSVTLTITKSLLGSSSTSEYKGTYSIDKTEDGAEQITLTFEGDGSSYSGTSSFAEGKNADGKSFIKIGGIEFTKQ